jgi:hypothetical protein
MMKTFSEVLFERYLVQKADGAPGWGGGSGVGNGEISSIGDLKHENSGEHYRFYDNTDNNSEKFGISFKSFSSIIKQRTILPKE